MKQTTGLLMQAANEISKLMDGHVTAIEFEDGSCHNFNYKINYGHWKFINLGPSWLIDIESYRSELNMAIQTRDKHGFINTILKISKSYGKSFGAHVYHAIEMAKLMGKDDMINEIFIGE